MQRRFLDLADHLFTGLPDADRLQLHCRAERSDFIRYTQAAVRQAGTVAHTRLSLRLIRGRRHATLDLDLAGDATDRSRAQAALEELRSIVAVVPEDPHLLLPEQPLDSEHCEPSTLPDATEISSTLLDAAAGSDLVGVLTVGPVFRGFADSMGQRNTFERASFQLSTSIFAHTDKAEKVDLAGLHFDGPVLRAHVAQARSRLPLLHRPQKVLEPGSYRAYLAPAAMAAYLQLVSRDSFSKSAVEKGYCSLLPSHRGERFLSERVTVHEDAAGGLGPRFDSWGFQRPARLTLLQEGRPQALLVSPKSAAEYGVATTGAGAWESTESVLLEPGELAEADALAALGTGLYISNLHYLNYVDSSSGRVTGMTRFATHWVEHGEIVAPLAVMRFDDGIYRMLGSELEALTDRVELTPSVYDYDGRTTLSFRTPGALLRSLRLAL